MEAIFFSALAGIRILATNISRHQIDGHHAGRARPQELSVDRSLANVIIFWYRYNDISVTAFYINLQDPLRSIIQLICKFHLRVSYIVIFYDARQKLKRTDIYFVIPFSYNILGSKRIYAVYFTRGQCVQQRFQPIKFQTNAKMSDCVFSKTLCSEKGQVVYKDNSSKYDTTCRCDYTKNFSFIKTPRHLCFCKPTEEDCSCYIKSCPVNLTLSTGTFIHIF